MRSWEGPGRPQTPTRFLTPSVPSWLQGQGPAGVGGACQHLRGGSGEGWDFCRPSGRQGSARAGPRPPPANGSPWVRGGVHISVQEKTRGHGHLFL